MKAPLVKKWKLGAGRTRNLSLAATLATGPAEVQRLQARVSVRSRSHGRLVIQPVRGDSKKTIRYRRGATVKRVRVPVTSVHAWRLRNGGRTRITVSVRTLRALTPTSPAAPGTNPPTTPISSPPLAPGSGAPRLDISDGTMRDVWVDPVAGSDTSSGANRNSALRSVTEAWNRIPASQSLSEGVRIQLLPGQYPAGLLPNYWENRWGTRTAPVILNAVDGGGTVTFNGDINLFNSRHFYLIGVDVKRDGDAFHCERCSNVLIRNAVLDGDVNRGGDQAHEALKVNQSDHVYVEDSTLRGADDNALDFVAVQHGHILGNTVSQAGDWCGYVKGGSAHILVAENRFFSCGTGGFTAGQGTGLEFMTRPWINYEAYGVRIVNNIVHDTQGAGLGVNGGFNILLAYNTLYRVGARSHVLEVIHGVHSCDGAHAGESTAGCASNAGAGGWGTTTTADTQIPNKHVYVYNNLVLNPAGIQSAWQHLAVAGPREQSTNSHAPDPSRADDDLRIAGNLIWNGPESMPLGVGDGSGCGESNPMCNESQLRRENSFNTIALELQDPGGGDYRPTPELLAGIPAAKPIPDFGWADAPAPGMGESGSSNTVPHNAAGQPRSGWGHAGAL